MFFIHPLDLRVVILLFVLAAIDFCESMEKKVHKKNYQKIMNGSEEEMLTLEAQK